MTFCASIHCMDGRIQEPIIQYLKAQYHISYVDAITEPSPCKILAEQTDLAAIDSIHRRLRISVDFHGTQLIAISGHCDCAANNSDEATHTTQILKSIKYLTPLYPNQKFIALWIDPNWEVHEKPVN